MSQLHTPPCPFDWVGGKNDKLKGGVLLGVTDHRFAYGFSGEQGLKSAFIAHVDHGEGFISLLTTHSDEMAHLLALVVDRLGEVDGLNAYLNQGAPAGMTVADHAHLHVVRRNAGEPASGMGLAKLVDEFNELYRSMWSGGT